jgi:hypothetical protein
MSRIRRLERIEGRIAQQERLAVLEDLKEVAETARNKILERIAAYRCGEPIPEPAIRHDGPHYEALRQRLNLMRSRLEQFGDVRRKCHDIST